MRWFTSRLYRKILLAFLAVALLPLCMVYFYIDTRYSDKMEQDAVRMNRMAEESAGIQLSDFLTKIEYISNMFFDGAIQEILNRADDTLSLYNARAALEKSIRVDLDLYHIMEQVDQITFIKRNGTRFDIMNSNNRGSLADFAELAERPDAVYKYHGIYEFPMLEGKLVYIRKINDSSALDKEIGYLFIVFDKTQLARIFAGLEQVIQTKIQIVSSDGTLLYTNFEGDQPEGSGWTQWEYQLEEFHLSVIFYDQLEKINASVQELNNLAKAAILFCVLGILLISLTLSKTLVMPVIRIHDRLLSIRDGDFKVRVPIETKDELGDVGMAFNDMAEEIDRLVNQVYSIQLKEKDAAIAALQTQINPHFLYNTLDMIKSMADIYEAYELRDVIMALSKVFRYATNTHCFMVTIQDELSNLQNYMKIITTRFDGRIQCDIQVQEELLKEQIIKVCLQPLVENAVSHGMGRGKRCCRIQVMIERQQEDIVIRVEDDGAGISEERLREIREELTDLGEDRTQEKKIGVGLKNIHDRIRLYYGEAYGVTIESQIEKGTRVWVRYPFHAWIQAVNERRE